MIKISHKNEVITTSNLTAGDKVYYGAAYTGGYVSTIISKEKAFKARTYIVTIQYANGSIERETFSSNKQWEKVGA